MSRRWQCDVCGTPYRVNWLSHCYRCEALPRAPKPKSAPEKPVRSRRKRMARIVAGVGPSDARAELEHPAAEPVVEALPEPEPEPVAAPVEPETEPVAVEDAPVVVEAPEPVVDAPVAAPKDGAA